MVTGICFRHFRSALEEVLVRQLPLSLAPEVVTHIGENSITAQLDSASLSFKLSLPSRTAR
jgi:hypothetical protein